MVHQVFQAAPGFRGVSHAALGSVWVRAEALPPLEQLKAGSFGISCSKPFVRPGNKAWQSLAAPPQASSPGARPDRVGPDAILFRVGPLLFRSVIQECVPELRGSRCQRSVRTSA